MELFASLEMDRPRMTNEQAAYNVISTCGQQ